MRMEQTTHAPGQLRRILPGVLLAAGLVWLMTGLFAPLTLGLLLAALMAPMAEALSRHTGCPRRLAAVGTMALFYLLLGLGLTAAGSWAARTGRTAPPAAAPAVEFLPASGSGTAPAPAGGVLRPVCPGHSAAGGLAAAALERSLPGLLSGLSSRAASLTARWLSRLPALLLGSVFTVILSFCVAADYPRLCTLLRDKVPPGLTALLGELRYFGSRVLLRMLRAWAILSLVLLAVMSAGLWLLGVEHPLAAAFAITLLDLLPLIGSGMILLPWGLWELCRGRAALGVGLWLLFGSAELLGPSWNPGCWAPAPDCLRWYSPQRSLPDCGWAGHWEPCCSRQRYCSCGIWAARGSCPGFKRRTQTADFPFSGQQKSARPTQGRRLWSFYARTQQQGRISSQ